MNYSRCQIGRSLWHTHITHTMRLLVNAPEQLQDLLLNAVVFSSSLVCRSRLSLFLSLSRGHRDASSSLLLVIHCVWIFFYFSIYFCILRPLNSYARMHASMSLPSCFLFSKRKQFTFRLFSHALIGRTTRVKSRRRSSTSSTFENVSYFFAQKSAEPNRLWMQWQTNKWKERKKILVSRSVNANRCVVFEFTWFWLCILPSPSSSPHPPPPPIELVSSLWIVWLDVV